MWTQVINYLSIFVEPMQLDLPFHEEDSEHNGGSPMKDLICQTSKHLSTTTPHHGKTSKGKLFMLKERKPAVCRGP